MSSQGRPAVPAMPRVISPSPTPSEMVEDSDSSYLGPVTRSAARRRQTPSLPPQASIRESADEDDADPELRRARTRSRSPLKTRSVSGLTSAKSSAAKTGRKARRDSGAKPEKPQEVEKEEGNTEEPSAGGSGTSPNGHLAPPPSLASGWSWRDLSRSPSPLGLIPIHRHFRTFIHKHEVPRKVLHVSIGFVVYWLYVSGCQTSSVTPVLMSLLVPIATTDLLRHRYVTVNAFYVRCLGALMRESEYAGWNGVIFYLLGAWAVLYFLPKDVAVVSVMLLSWCDTAASTFGRLYGRYTPRLRRGKSLAGSLAAFAVGVATAGWFWGYLAPLTGPFAGDEQHPFQFRGSLSLPGFVVERAGLTGSQATVTGPVAVGILSVWSGLAAAASEVVDIFGWDDNLTIPVLSGLGIWGFLKVFG